MKKFLFFVLMLMSLFLVACEKSEKEDVAPILLGVDSITIPWGLEFDVRAGVTATDDYDGDLTSEIEVTGEVDIFRSTKFVVTYKVVDSKGNVTEINREITVDFPTDADLIRVSKDSSLVEEYLGGNNLDLSQDGSSTAVGGVPGWSSWGSGGSYSVSEGVLTVDVGTHYFQVSNNNNELITGQRYIVLFDVKAQALHRKDTADYTFRAIWGNEANGWDDHRIVYWPEKPITTSWETYAFMFEARSNEKNVLCLVSQELKNTLYFKNIHVYEFKPVEKTIATISGVEDLSVAWGTNVDIYEDVIATDSKDGNLTAAMTVSAPEINPYISGEYEVTYSVKNSSNKVTTVVRKITILPPTVQELLLEAAKEENRPYVGNNTDFATDGTNVETGWWSWGNGGPYSITDGEMTITVGVDYFQVSNNNNTFYTGQNYIVTFDIKADVNHVVDNVPFTFRSIVGSEASGWNPYHEQYFAESITTEWQTFGFAFNCAEGAKGVILFAFENLANTIYMKNLVITEIDPLFAPAFTGVDDSTVSWGTNVDLTEGVSATDAQDGDLTASITIDKEFDPFFTGEQVITYTVKNSHGMITTVTRTITVEAPTVAELLAEQEKEVHRPYTSNNINFQTDGTNAETGWLSWGWGGPYSVSESVLTVDVDVHYFQISNNNNSFYTGQRYIVTFEAKANFDHFVQDGWTFKTIVGSEATGWNPYFEHIYTDTITTEWKTFGFVFDCKQGEKGALLFVWEKFVNTIFMRNLNVVEMFPKLYATIDGNTDLDVAFGGTVDVLDGITATDPTDGDITSNVTFDSFDTLSTGVIEVKIRVTNSLGLETVVVRKVTVLTPTQADLDAIINAPTTTPHTGINLDLSSGGDSATGTILNWSSWGNGGPYSVTDGVMTVNVNTNYFQIANSLNNFEVGKRYLVTFQVKGQVEQFSSAGWAFRVIVGSEESGWVEDHIQYFEQTIGTEYTTFSFLFEAKHETKNVFCFVFDRVVNVISLKDINVYKIN